MDVWSLASGSSGNCYLVRAAGTLLLVEAGITLRKIETFLAKLGVTARDIAGVLLTHEHSDHIRSARMLSDKYQLPLFATAGTLGHQSLRDSAWARPIQAGKPLRIGEVEATAFAVPHDTREPVGYRLTAQAATVCITTDLGFVPKEVGRQFRDNDLLVLEANHDVEMLHQGPYPAFLKRRVLGDHGHLSNVATADALLACRDRVPSQVWLAHLSPTNNTPERARTEIVGRLAAAGYGHVDLQVAARTRPSLHWSSVPRPVQLNLF